VKAGLIASLARQLKNNLFGYYAGLDYQYFIKNNTGHYVNVLNGQVNKFIQSFNVFAKFSAGIITTAVYLGISFYLNAGFTAMALGAAGILLFFLKYVSRYSKKLSIKTSQENSNLNKFLVQTLYAMKYLQATGRFQHLSKNIECPTSKMNCTK
jgi:ABC-type bacteriocin/lantibiotic exporter with double-glycine peptidase domain